MVGYIVRRLLWAAGTVVLTAFFAYGIIRVLRPERYPTGEAVLAGTWRDVEDALFGFTLGEDYVHEEFVRGFAADHYLLAGGLVVAIGLGLAGGIWCTVRDRSRSARAVESAAVVFLCTPVYVLALGTLLLFAPPFGLVQLPYFSRTTPARRGAARPDRAAGPWASTGSAPRAPRCCRSSAPRRRSWS